MRRRLAATTVCLLVLALTGAAQRRDLRIVFIDVEGGQSTLIVTPAGQSMLIDAGYAGRGQRGAPPPPPGAVLGRDPGRILAVLREAGVERLDYLLVTHFHGDHVGGVPELAAHVPIDTVVDYGQPLGTDRMAVNGFRNYEAVRATRRHVEARVGERIPLDGVEATIVSAGGTLLQQPLPGAGARNPACVDVEDHPEDGTENYRSVGVLLTYGAFRFLDLGDLSGNTLTRLACPIDLVGPVSAYLIAHHGDYDTSVPALYAALRPAVAIMNNGVSRGGDPDAFRVIRRQPAMDLWQLHASRNPGAENAPDAFLANVDDGTRTAFSLTLTASADGRFRMVNERTGFAREYGPTRGQ